MILHVIEAKYLYDYKIWISFNNGNEGVVDLENELTGEVFEPLVNKEEFRKISVHPIMETVVWDNGADLAPEFLLSLILNPIKKVG